MRKIIPRLNPVQEILIFTLYDRIVNQSVILEMIIIKNYKYRLNFIRSALLIAAMLLSTFLLFNRPSNAYIWPKYDGYLKVPISDSNISLTPAQEMSYEELGLFFAVYDCLFYINDADLVMPNLAEKFETEDQYTRYIIQINRYAQFHDGSIMTANDVVSSIKNNLAGFGQRGQAFENISLIRAIDNHTLEINLKNADPDLPRKLAYPVCAVVKGDGIERASGSTRLFHFTGSGPFKIDDVNSQRIRLIRNEKYHRGRAYLKSIEFQVILSEEDSYLKFASGKLHLHRVPYKQYGELMRRENVNLINRDGKDTIILDFGNSPYRANLIKSLEPDEIVNVVMNHAGRGVKGILPDDKTGFLNPESYSNSGLGIENEIVLGYFGDVNLLEPIAKRIETEWESKGFSVSVMKLDEIPCGICDVVLRIVKTMNQDADFTWLSTRYSLGAEGKLADDIGVFVIPELKEEAEMIKEMRFFPIARPNVVYALADDLVNFRLLAGCVPDYWSISL